MKKLIQIFIFVGLFSNITGQNQYTLKINTLNDTKNISKNYSYKKKFNDSLSLYREIYDFINVLHDDGYLAASNDSTICSNKDFTAYVSIGNKYSMVSLRRGNIDYEILKNINYNPKRFNKKPFNYKDLSKLSEKILMFCENNGYPFASIKLDSIIFDNDNILASFNLVKHNFIYIDTIIVKENNIVSANYICNYLNLKQKKPYNEKYVKTINTKLRDIQFLRQSRPFEIYFSKKNAKILFYLEKKKANQFDGIIGFMPNSQKNNELLITGEAHLKLLNSFAKGELIEFNWRKVQTNTQDLNINFNYPYLLNTPIGIDLKFALLKQDTTYLNTNYIIGFQYLFNGSNYLKAFYESFSSVLLSTSKFKNATVLPEFADMTTNLYGLEFKFEKLDYKYNPRKGFSLKINNAAGTKNIKKINDLPEKLYKNIKLSSSQYRLFGKYDLFIPVLSKSTINIGISSAKIINDNIFDNELLKIGGLKSLRGFDEDAIKASFYTILNTEYRYLYEENSYLCLFWNGAYYEKKLHNIFISDKPYGFGFGICFETKAGIFTINYALGKEFSNPIMIKSAKIHFGIVSYF